MKQKLGFFEIDCETGMYAELLWEKQSGDISEYRFRLGWKPEHAEADDAFVFTWSVPMTGIMYSWNPLAGTNRDVSLKVRQNTMISYGAPLYCYYDGTDTNRYCITCSETQMLLGSVYQVEEETGCLRLQFSLGVRQYTQMDHTELTFRIDQRWLPVYEIVAAAAAWWETEQGLTPAMVPEDARKPCYSFWYSYHQNMTDGEVEAECRRAKDLGFEICIVDDGWQTSDLKRGYAYSGDWVPAAEKFPDMAAHVQRVHDLGMKYMLWYSVPFMGYHAERYGEFEPMLLRKVDRLQTGVLDPRYARVRRYLIDTYKHALLDWNLDGLKLDFVDYWKDSPENAPYDTKMDIPALQDAVHALMIGILEELRAVRPDVLIEFRQRYIGPRMRQFGNMFRVVDCPVSYVQNRTGVLDLRMMMGRSAVHSDMLMWHPDESPERNAVQMIGVLFGVLQYSARLDQLSPDNRRMSQFWLKFLQDHRQVLLDGALRSYEPHLFYTWAQALGDDTCIAAVYAADKCIKPEPRSKVCIANGSVADRILAELDGDYEICVQNCYGEEIRRETRKFSGVQVLPVPMGGLITMERLTEV